ncbi:hypothetical protein KSP40_PGU016769 [Platanthera guangdongensis]|uniref:Uncharacterized protein n=1 Tax=Platanthera guangdongensis TaxID=2320717 RepID=A0ABR2MXV0_9ASPA
MAKPDPKVGETVPNDLPSAPDRGLASSSKLTGQSKGKEIDDAPADHGTQEQDDLADGEKIPRAIHTNGRSREETEWISRHDPYVVLEYASTKFRTRTCTGFFGFHGSGSASCDCCCSATAVVPLVSA